MEIAVHWYPFAYASTFLWVWLWARYLVSRGELWKDNISPVSQSQVDGGRLWIFLGVIVGARLGYVLFYQPEFYVAHPEKILRLWEGGMSFHGGLLGVLFFGALYVYAKKIPFLSGFDIIAVTIPFGFFVGRIANFFNGELWGRPTTVPWAVAFPGKAAQICPQYWVGECTRHPSQLYEAALEGGVLLLLMYWLALSRDWLKIPGQMVSVFLIGYGSARLFVEYFREADAQFQSPDNPLGYALRLDIIDSGLTMGQILSVPMIIVGLSMLLYLKAADNGRKYR